MTDDLTDGEREQRYNDNYKSIHGHWPWEPHSTDCVPDPRYPWQR